jgi:hypothetical protein
MSKMTDIEGMLKGHELVYSDVHLHKGPVTILCGRGQQRVVFCAAMAKTTYSLAEMHTFRNWILLADPESDPRSQLKLEGDYWKKGSYLSIGLLIAEETIPTNAHFLRSKGVKVSDNPKGTFELDRTILVRPLPCKRLLSRHSLEGLPPSGSDLPTLMDRFIVRHIVH